jgi:uncharacterized protein YndB with AHSA1/START domain
MGLQIGTLHIRRSIFIRATPARVWQEFEPFERMQAWLSIGHLLHRFELRVGGVVEMSVEVDGERRFYGGKVLVADSQQEVSFESQWRPPHSWPVPTFWTIRLSPLYDGTHVELFHHGFERLADQAADNLQGYEEGWDLKHLTTLRKIVEG